MWQQFNDRNIVILDEFVAGLKRSRAAYFKFTREDIIGILLHKPHGEGWIYRDANLNLGMVMGYKVNLGRHRLMHCFFTGTFTPSAAYQLVEAKMDEYVARHGKTGWDVPMPKDCTNEMGTLNPSGFRTTITARKASVVGEDTVTHSYIRFNPR